MKSFNVLNIILLLVVLLPNKVICQVEDKDSIAHDVVQYNYNKKEETLYTVKDAQDCLVKAKNGDTNAMHRVAWLYCGGLGMKTDYDSAFYWIQKAAQTGDPASMCSLGWFYEHGRGTDQDFAKAFYWYKKSAEKNYAAAECDVGFYYEYGYQVVPKDLKQAEYWFERATKHGDNTAKKHLEKIRKLIVTDRYTNSPETDYELAAPIPNKK
jgi:TPR repeat protein